MIHGTIFHSDTKIILLYLQAILLLLFYIPKWRLLNILFLDGHFLKILPLFLWWNWHPAFSVQFWLHSCNFHSTRLWLPNLLHLFHKVYTFLSLQEFINTSVFYKKLCLVTWNICNLNSYIRMISLWVLRKALYLNHLGLWEFVSWYVG